MKNENTIGNDPGSLHARAWAEEHESIDRQLSPLGLVAMQELRLFPGQTVLDIGCGTGQTLLQLAERVGDQGLVFGIDIAAPLLGVAARRTKQTQNVKLIQSDAQTLDLPPHSVDAIFSRFGVMSFNDPVAAFSNFRRMLKPNGRLAFCCWQVLQKNELDHFPLTIAGFQSAADEGPFSFADPKHVQNMLKKARFEDVTVRAHEQPVSSGDAESMTRVLLRVGPLGKIVRENPAIQSIVETKLRKAFASFGEQSDVFLNAAVWIVTARA